MATYADIKTFGNNPKRVRALAKSLLAHAGADWTDWELDFLDSMAAQPDGSTLSDRQVEKLCQVRDRLWSALRNTDRYNLPSIYQSVSSATLDLPEEHADFVASLDPTKLELLSMDKRARLLDCAQRLNVIESSVG